MLERTAEPVLAEKFLWEARECLIDYPEILAQFDAIFIGHQPVSVMMRDLHECMIMKKGVERRMSQQVTEPEQSSRVQ